MSHPNPGHERSNEYPDDHYKPGGKKKHPHPIFGDMLTTDLKESIRGGKRNAKRSSAITKALKKMK